MESEKYEVEISGEEILCEEFEQDVNEDIVETPKNEFSLKIKNFLKEKIFCLVGMIVSLVFIIMSFSLINGNAVSSVKVPDSVSTGNTRYQYYGGDAYTGIQQAAADASNNAAAAVESIGNTNEILAKMSKDIQKSVSTSVGMLMLTISGIGFCYFLAGLKKENKNN